MPVFAASDLRPLTLRAASSSPLVVRMPIDLSLAAAKDGRPSMSEIGYVMILDIQRTLCEMTEARRPGNNFVDPVRADLVAAESEKFTRHVLNLADVEAKRHQPGAERH